MRFESDGEEALEREIANAQPEDTLAARVAAVAFLRTLGRRPSPVTIGGYELERSLGSGGFGRVYLAKQPGLNRPVALKVLHEERRLPARHRFRREAHALARLNHPHVVQVFQVGDAPEGTFIAMEYVDGGPLRGWQGGRPWQEVLEMYLQAGRGLAAAHERGILHLDFKPSNVLVGRDGRARVADFGLAAGSALSTGDDDDASAEQSGARATRAHGATRGYASPEQATGATVDVRSDQFSFCAALFEALHGTLPFTAEEIAAGMRESTPPMLGRGAGRCPRWIDRAIVRGLRTAPGERWPSLNDLLAALSLPSWRRGLPAVALVGMLGTSLLAALLSPDANVSSCEDFARRMAPRWDAARRESLRASLEGRGPPWTEELRNTVIDALERSADQVLEVGVVACSAARADERTFAPAWTCLQRERDRFEGVLKRLEDADDRLGSYADGLVAQLNQPASCATPTESAFSVASISRAADVVRAIDLVRVDVAAGDLSDALRRAQEVVDAAERLDSGELLAEALLVRGLARDAAGHDDDAVVDLEASAAAATAVGRDDLAAESWRRASWIAADDLVDLGRSERWARLGRSAVLRLGNPPTLDAEQLDAEGLLQRLQADPVAAERSHRAALSRLDTVWAADHPRRNVSWLLLAHALADQGRASEAGDAYERALSLAESRLGSSHPQIATILVARGLLARDIANAGDPTLLEAAANDLARASEIIAGNDGKDPAFLASTHVLRAEVLLLLGRLENAGSLAREASVMQRGLFESHPERGSALTVLARVELAHGNWERALEVHLELARERASLDDDTARAALENNIGWLLCRVNRCDEARRYYQRAFERGDALQRAYAEAGRGRVELAAGHAELGRVLLESALANCAKLDHEAPHDLVAEARWHLAEARVQLGDHSTDVASLVDDAVAYFSESGSDPLALASLERLSSPLARAPEPRHR